MAGLHFPFSQKVCADAHTETGNIAQQCLILSIYEEKEFLFELDDHHGGLNAECRFRILRWR